MPSPTGPMWQHSIMYAQVLQVGASIRVEHTEQGVHEAHRKRQIHEDSRVAKLLAVPRYADVIKGVHADPALHADAESSRCQPTLITLKTAWREVMAVWAREQQESEALAAGSGLRWLPRSLELLFGVSKKPAEAPRHKGVFRLEERLMELLEAEASEEETGNDSGDEYDPGTKA